ncbi:hypothetical protein GCM10010149_63610 [Nonomuraea roseoviolacea subsp. roseoviolacea]
MRGAESAANVAVTYVGTDAARRGMCSEPPFHPDPFGTSDASGDGHSVEYVKIGVTAEGRTLDPGPYLAVLPVLSANLPDGARSFVTDPAHYDFYGRRCVKDLCLASLAFIRDGDEQSIELTTRRLMASGRLPGPLRCRLRVPARQSLLTVIDSWDIDPWTNIGDLSGSKSPQLLRSSTVDGRHQA